MLIKFWIAENDLYPVTFASGQIIAIEVAPYDSRPVQERHDIVIYTSGHKFRFPKSDRNWEEVERWLRWAE